jgi:Ca2+/Na+ antiporter
MCSYAVDKDGISEAVAILFCTVFLFLGVLLVNKWKMTPRLGQSLFFLYICYVGYTIGKEALKTCS